MKGEGTQPKGSTPPTEGWCHLAIVLLVLLAAAFAYLGSRPGGRGPLLIYNFGRDVIFILAFLTLVFGVFRSVRRPPFSRPGRVRAFVALALVIGVAPYRLPYPSSREDRPSRTAFELPVRGTWRTYWGGDDKDTNRMVGYFADRRFGLHLVREVDGERLRPVEDRPDRGVPAPGLASEAERTPSGLRPQDYWSYGETIYAPAAGRVIAVRDGIEDSPLGRPLPGVLPAGNQLILETGDGEFLFMSHLAAGSIQVEVGDEVTSGQPVARVGYSGFSPVTPEPHVALHLQTTPEEGWGEGIPWRFHGYSADGKSVGAGVPLGGVDARLGLIGQVVTAGPEPVFTDSDH